MNIHVDVRANDATELFTMRRCVEKLFETTDVFV